MLELLQKCIITAAQTASTRAAESPSFCDAVLEWCWWAAWRACVHADRYTDAQTQTC